MHIAVVGAGPAGTWASILLAQRGHSVTLIDSQAPWEKPCGGGVTAKALSGFGIFDSDLPRNNIDRVTLDRKSTRLNSSHVAISYAVFCLKKKRITESAS